MQGYYFTADEIVPSDHRDALFNAAEKGITTDITSLLRTHYGLDQYVKNGITPVHAAAFYGMVDSIRVLAEFQFDLNTRRCDDGLSPLGMAAGEGWLEATETLVGLGADINLCSDNGSTPVYVAASAGHVKVVTRLAEMGAEIHEPRKQCASPIYAAAQFGHEDVIRALVTLGVDVNTKWKSGSTPLHAAVSNGHTGCVRTLLEELGANLHACRTDGTSVAYMAACKGRMDMLALLEELGADLFAPMNDGTTPLLAAALADHTAVVEWLVERGADTNTPDNDGYTPLLVAAQRNNVALIKVLVGHGADVHVRWRDGATPLHAAAQRGYTDVVSYLADHGADISAVVQTGGTPALHAAAGEFADTLRVLLRLGADLNTPSENGDTPLCVASREYHRKSVVLFLVNRGVDLRACLRNTPKDVVNQYHEMLTKKFMAFDWPEFCGEPPPWALCMFSLTKMVTSALGSAGTCGSVRGQCCFGLSEHAIAVNVRDVLSGCGDIVGVYDATSYVVKRELLHLAYHTFTSALSVVGDRWSEDVKARRLVETVWLCLNKDMLTDVLSLRMTCKSNCERMRFPHYVGDRCVSELEANVIEEWLGCGSCRYITSGVLFSAQRLHMAADVSVADTSIRAGGVVTPILIASEEGYTNISKILLQNGADLSLCLSKNRNREEVNYIYDIVDKCTGQFAHLEDDYISRGCLVSLSKLIFQKTTSNPEFSRLGGLSSVVVENYLILHLEDALSSPRLKCLHNTPHVLKSKLLSMSCRSFFATLPANGSALNPEMMMQRCVHLACLFLDLPMVREVLALRMTCKSNCDRMRFPTCRRGGKYEELEVNVIEEWLCYGSSRLASTKILFQVLREHEISEEKQSLNKKNDS